MLEDLQIPQRCFTATGDQLLDSFYRPAFANSVLYRRGVAYFSIQFYLNLMDSIVDFVINGGRIELITSVQLDVTTVEAIKKGYTITSLDIEKTMISKLREYRQTDFEGKDVFDAKMDVIANLIAARRLVSKVALVEGGGIYHEKLGIFTDDNDYSISFLGSANETINAFKLNYETVQVFSEKFHHHIVEDHKDHFDALWNGHVSCIKTLDFPDAVSSEIIIKYKRSEDVETAINSLLSLKKKAKKKELWWYQRDAIEEFARRDFCHLFEMATGTGKTFTAIKAIEKMAESHPYINVIILVPLKDLQRQWEDAIKAELDVPHSISKFGGVGKDSIRDFNMTVSGGTIGNGKFIGVAICVYDTFFSDVVNQLDPIEGETLIIVDEAHNLTPGGIMKLNGLTKHRLGLSATPTRYSEKETAMIKKYFLPDGGASFVFGLKDAIDAGFLSHYNYHAINVVITDEEYESYQELSSKIGRAQAIYDNDPSVENYKILNELKIKRSLIVKKTPVKLDKLYDMANSVDFDFTNSVVFSGPGNVVIDGIDTNVSIVNKITKILSEAKPTSYYPSKFTSSQNDRVVRLIDFKRGITDTLVAIKCFDEGMDVPALDKIYLIASDASLRQTIQRRGRVLRISKSTDKNVANIYDMVAGIMIGDIFTPLSTELPRIKEYASLADNRDEIFLAYDLFDVENLNEDEEE